MCNSKKKILLIKKKRLKRIAPRKAKRRLLKKWEVILFLRPPSDKQRVKKQKYALAYEFSDLDKNFGITFNTGSVNYNVLGLLP